MLIREGHESYKATDERVILQEVLGTNCEMCFVSDNLIWYGEISKNSKSIMVELFIVLHLFSSQNADYDVFVTNVIYDLKHTRLDML
jgi:hypothetical protein